MHPPRLKLKKKHLKTKMFLKMLRLLTNIVCLPRDGHGENDRRPALDEGHLGVVIRRGDAPPKGRQQQRADYQARAEQ